MAGFEEDAPLDAAPMKRPGKATGSPPADKPTVAAKSATPAPAEIEAENMLALVGDKPIDVLQSEEKRAALYQTIRDQIALQQPDLTTQAGRDRVKSFAFKIVRTRTAIVAAGKESTAEMRKQIDAQNKVRSDTEAALEILEAEARKPLTVWEEEQAANANKRKEILQQMAVAAASNHLSAPDLKDLQIDIEAIELDAALWGDDLQMVTDRQAEVVAMLDAKIQAEEARQVAAAAQAELETMRAQQSGHADTNAASLQPVYTEDHEQGETRTEAPPPAATGGAPLTPIQKARRLVLPALAELGIPEEKRKALILAIEAGQLPGIVATYLEKN